MKIKTEMKKYLLIAGCLLFILNFSFSQQGTYKPKSLTTNFWSLGIDGGATIPLGTFKDTYSVGGNVGLELSFNTTRKFALVCDIQLNFLSTKDTSYSGTSSYVEGTVGGRYLLGKGPMQFFGEAALGDYIYDYSLVEIDGNITTYSKHNLGVYGGMGVNFSASARSAFFLKAKYHHVFTSGSPTNYIGLYAGLKFII
jgi:hypothetical protein